MEIIYSKINNAKEESVILFSDGDVSLQFSPIELKDEYRKKWNVLEKDFFMLTRNGELISNHLYRIGGMKHPNLNKDKYFQILKYTESQYPDNITKDKNKKNHLQGLWTIFDKYGIEKVESKKYESIYIVKDSCIYSINGDYFNIETGEYYGYSSKSIYTDNFIFLDNRNTKDKSKCGVMKINKQDGSFEVFN